MNTNNKDGYNISCSCVRKYNGKIGCSLKLKLNEHCNGIVHKETMKSGMADRL